MEIYEIEKDEDVVESIIDTLENNTGEKIFTIKVLERNKDGLYVIVVFENKAVLNGYVTVTEIDGKLACRVRGNYI